MLANHPIRQDDDRIDPRLEGALRYFIAIGVTLLVLLPAARGFSAAVGWLPLWLLAMPLTAWWALHRFRLPLRLRDERPQHARRRPGTQARRRQRRAVRPALPRAA